MPYKKYFLRCPICGNTHISLGEITMSSENIRHMGSLQHINSLISSIAVEFVCHECVSVSKIDINYPAEDIINVINGEMNVRYNRN
jgi:predicted nucleic-acid-binding Zn-ribbon protein